MKNNVTKITDYKIKQNREYEQAVAEGEAFFSIVGLAFVIVMTGAIFLCFR